MDVINYSQITDSVRPIVNKHIIDWWYTTDMVVNSEIIDLNCADGICAWNGNELVGLAMFRTINNICELLSLNSIVSGRGIGSQLIKRLIACAMQTGCSEIQVVTTNDNINALAFYQKCGFRITAILPDAVTRSRKIKPEIPLNGDNGIPVSDEICLTYYLQ